MVERSAEWPGLTCLPQLLGPARRLFQGFSWTKRWSKRRSEDLEAGEGRFAEEIAEPVELVVEPLPCWNGLGEEERLSLSTHKSLLSRLHTRLRLEPVSADDSADYLRHRLQLAGCDRELFPLDSVALLHEASQGAHRELDRLASLCLREAARRKRKLVERDLARSVLDRQPSSAA